MSDPCECFFNQEAAVQRLLAILRNTQTYCTDSECSTDDVFARAGDNSMMLWTLLWTVLAMGMYFMRPNSMRTGANQQREEAVLEKPTTSNDQPPPPPPPSAM